MSGVSLHYGKFRIRWFDENGKRCSQVFNSRKEAKEALIRLQYEVNVRIAERAAGIEPEKYFDDLIAYWLEHRAAYKRSKKDDIYIIRRYLSPAFSKSLLKNIKTSDIDRLKKSNKHLNPKTLSNILTLLISMMRLAVDLDWLSKMPVIKKPSTKLFSKDYRFLKTNEEIQNFLQASKTEGDLIYSLYATAIFTGMRQGELAGLRFSDIDYERNLITVQRSYDGPTKSDRVRYVPLLATLKPILVQWRAKNSNEIVFPNRKNKMSGPASRAFKAVLRRVIKRANLPQVVHNGKVKTYICFHDLRHTFASHWMMNGGDLFKLQRILGHQDSKMTQRYSHLSPAAFRDDYNRLSNLHNFEDENDKKTSIG